MEEQRRRAEVKEGNHRMAAGHQHGTAVGWADAAHRHQDFQEPLGMAVSPCTGPARAGQGLAVPLRQGREARHGHR